MNKSEFIIRVETETELSNEQKMILLADFRNRLQGYHTQAPDFLEGAGITITRKLTNDDIMQSLQDK